MEVTHVTSNPCFLVVAAFKTCFWKLGWVLQLRFEIQIGNYSDVAGERPNLQKGGGSGNGMSNLQFKEGHV